MRRLHDADDDSSEGDQVRDALRTAQDPSRAGGKAAAGLGLLDGAPRDETHDVQIRDSLECTQDSTRTGGQPAARVLQGDQRPGHDPAGDQSTDTHGDLELGLWVVSLEGVQRLRGVDTLEIFLQVHPRLDGRAGIPECRDATRRELGSGSLASERGLGYAHGRESHGGGKHAGFLFGCGVK